MANNDKQLALKPQDLVVTIKIAVNRERDMLLTELAAELCMALSVVHGCIRRSEQARLLSRSAGSVRANRSSLKEFLLFGAKYSFPGHLGASTKGLATAIGAPSLREYFDQTRVIPPVWPSAEGDSWGPSLTPLHQTVPEAAKKDLLLYDLLSLFDAIRIGAARERELAATAIEERL